MSESASPESGALSVDQAIASLVGDPAPVEENTAPEAPVEAAEDEQPSEGESNAPEETGEAEEPGDGEETATDQQAEAEKLSAPQYWTTEEKEYFATLDRAGQEILLRQEGKREAVTAKAKAEAAEVRKTADAEVAKVQQLAGQLAETLPKVLNTLKSRWGDNPDWGAYAQQYGVEAMTLAKVQYESEVADAQKFARDTAQAQALAHEAFVKAEFAKLADIAPDLADPEKGAEKRTEVTQFLLKEGFDVEAVRRISASEMALARDAMSWRKAQAALRAPKPPKPAPQATQRPAARPTAAAPASSPQRTATAALQTFNKKLDPDSAVAWLLAKG